MKKRKKNLMQNTFFFYQVTNELVSFIEMLINIFVAHKIKKMLFE